MLASLLLLPSRSTMLRSTMKLSFLCGVDCGCVSWRGSINNKQQTTNTLIRNVILLTRNSAHSKSRASLQPINVSSVIFGQCFFLPHHSSKRICLVFVFELVLILVEFLHSHDRNINRSCMLSFNIK